MKKICKTCKNELLESFYTEQSGDSCIFCESKNIKSDPIAKKGGYEIVDDKGCPAVVARCNVIRRTPLRVSVRVRSKDITERRGDWLA